jgi:O-antigen ligase
MNGSRIDTVVGVGLLVAIVFTVLAHGAVESWSVGIFEIWIILLLFTWSTKVLIGRGIRLNIPVTFWPIAAFLAFGLLQSLQFGDSDGNITSLSRDVEATKTTVLILFFLLASHLIAADVFESEKRALFLIRFLTVFGVVLSIFSLIQYLTKESIFFWTNPGLAVGPWLSGPFVNHNHFAGFIELIIPLPIALVVTGAARESRILYGFGAAIMTAAAILTASRGGMISIAAGLILVAGSGYSFSRTKTSRPRNLDDKHVLFSYSSGIKRLVAIMALIAAFVGGIMLLGLDPVIERLPSNESIGVGNNTESFETSRGWIWRNSFKVFEAHPLTGTGMGSFETVFPLYSPGFVATPTGKAQVWERTHNDYLQVLTDTGLIGAAIAIWFLASLLFAARQGLRSKSRISQGLAIGCSAATLSILIHSLFDFNLQIPSTSLLFLILVALLPRFSNNSKPAS